VRKEPDYQSVSDADWQHAWQREAIIRPLAEDPRATHAYVDTVAGRLGLCRSHVYRLIARYRRRPQTSSLLTTDKGGRPQGLRLLELEREALIDRTIREFYLQRERPRMADLMREIRQRCHHENLKAPHLLTVQRRVLDIDAKRRVQLRLGSKIANAKFRPVQPSPFEDLMPLDLV
jgi:putative transposase